MVIYNSLISILLIPARIVWELIKPYEKLGPWIVGGVVLIWLIMLVSTFGAVDHEFEVNRGFPAALLSLAIGFLFTCSIADVGLFDHFVLGDMNLYNFAMWKPMAKVFLTFFLINFILNLVLYLFLARNLVVAFRYVLGTISGIILGNLAELLVIALLDYHILGPLGSILGVFISFGFDVVVAISTIGFVMSCLPQSAVESMYENRRERERLLRQQASRTSGGAGGSSSSDTTASNQSSIFSVNDENGNMCHAEVRNGFLYIDTANGNTVSTKYEYVKGSSTFTIDGVRYYNKD